MIDNDNMIISLIVATSTNNAIGRNGQLLWHLPNDLRFFKNTTWAMPVIMGRKTFESIGKPLSGRTNIVITRQPTWKAESVLIASCVNDALQSAETLKTNEVFIIGGGEIYQQVFPLASRLYITRVEAHITDADTFFPTVDVDNWQMVFKKAFAKDDKHVADYAFEVWERKDILK